MSHQPSSGGYALAPAPPTLPSPPPARVDQTFAATTKIAASQHHRPSSNISSRSQKNHHTRNLSKISTMSVKFEESSSSDEEDDSNSDLDTSIDTSSDATRTPTPESSISAMSRASSRRSVISASGGRLDSARSDIRSRESGRDTISCDGSRLNHFPISPKAATTAVAETSASSPTLPSTSAASPPPPNLDMSSSPTSNAASPPLTSQSTTAVTSPLTSNTNSRPNTRGSPTTGTRGGELNIQGEMMSLNPKPPQASPPRILRARRTGSQIAEGKENSSPALQPVEPVKPVVAISMPSSSSAQTDDDSDLLVEPSPPTMQSFQIDVIQTPTGLDRRRTFNFKDYVPISPQRHIKDSAPAAVVPSSVANTRIDYAIASQASVTEILQSKYVRDPFEEQQPDKEKRFGYEKAYREMKEGQLDPNEPGTREWLPYQQQGDSTLYNSQIMVIRDSLQYHPRIAKWISRYWHSFAHQYHVGYMAYREYEAMHLRMTKALYAIWDRQDAVQLCKLDWRRDTRALPGVAIAVTGSAKTAAAAGALMSYQHFSKSLFELVDLWTTTVDVEEYVDFLAILYARITVIVDADIADPHLKAKPAAPLDTKSHTDPSHHHNLTAEEAARRRRALKTPTPTGTGGPKLATDLLEPAEPPSPGTAILPSQRGMTSVEEESSLTTPADGVAWAGFGFMANYRTNVDEIRERKRARAEALAFEELHGHPPGPLQDGSLMNASSEITFLEQEDDAHRIQADGTIDSGTTRILPLIDHLRLADEAMAGILNDPNDSLNRRFPQPQFKPRSTRTESELALEIASSRMSISLPPSEEEIALRKMERTISKQQRAEAEAEAKENEEAMAKLFTDQQRNKLIDLAIDSAMEGDEKDNKDEGNEKDADTPPKKRRHHRSPHRKARRKLLRPSSALVAARARRSKAALPDFDPEDGSWFSKSLAKQEEHKRQMIDKAIAIRRQARVERALIAAQKRLAELDALEQQKRKDAAEKEERELDFFRQLDESIARADPSYVPPPFPSTASSSSSRRRSMALDLDDSEDSNAPGYRTRSSHISPRARLHGHLASSSPHDRRLAASGQYVPEEELDAARAEKAKVEERKRLAKQQKQAELEKDLKDPDEDFEGELDKILQDENTKVKPVPLDSIEPLVLDHTLGPLNQDGAYDEYTPELQSQLVAEIAKLSLLDAKLRHAFGSAAGGQTPVASWRPWEINQAEAEDQATGGKGGKKTALFMSTAERQQAKKLLLDQSDRLKFLRKKTKLAQKSGMENRAELRELAELEKRLEGRINKNGDILELSFLSLAMKSFGDKQEEDESGRYTGFKVTPVHQTFRPEFSINLAKAEGESKFWNLHKKIAKRRILKYSAMAILEEDESKEQQQEITINLQQPTTTRAESPNPYAPLHALFNPTSPQHRKSHKKTAIQRTLEANVSLASIGKAIKSMNESSHQSWSEQRAHELQAAEEERAKRLQKLAERQASHFSRRDTSPPRSDATKVILKRTSLTWEDAFMKASPSKTLDERTATSSATFGGYAFHSKTQPTHSDMMELPAEDQSPPSAFPFQPRALHASFPRHVPTSVAPRIQHHPPAQLIHHPPKLYHPNQPILQHSSSEINTQMEVEYLKEIGLRQAMQFGSLAVSGGGGAGTMRPHEQFRSIGGSMTSRPQPHSHQHRSPHRRTMFVPSMHTTTTTAPPLHTQIRSSSSTFSRSHGTPPLDLCLVAFGV